jgi:hypothetical protein
MIRRLIQSGFWMLVLFFWSTAQFSPTNDSMGTSLSPAMETIDDLSGRCPINPEKIVILKGAINQYLVTSKIAKVRREVNPLYQQTVDPSTTMMNLLCIRLVIAPDGSVKQVSIIDDSQVNTSVSNIVVSSLRLLTFGKLAQETDLLCCMKFEPKHKVMSNDYTRKGCIMIGSLILFALAVTVLLELSIASVE